MDIIDKNGHVTLKNVAESEITKNKRNTWSFYYIFKADDEVFTNKAFITSFRDIQSDYYIYKRNYPVYMWDGHIVKNKIERFNLYEIELNMNCFDNIFNDRIYIIANSISECTDYILKSQFANKYTTIFCLGEYDIQFQGFGIVETSPNYHKEMLRVTYDYYVFDSIYAYSKREYHNLFGLKIPHITKTSYKTKDNVIFVLTPSNAKALELTHYSDNSNNFPFDPLIHRHNRRIQYNSPVRVRESDARIYNNIWGEYPWYDIFEYDSSNIFLANDEFKANSCVKPMLRRFKPIDYDNLDKYTIFYVNGHYTGVNNRSGGQYILSDTPNLSEYSYMNIKNAELITGYRSGRLIFNDEGIERFIQEYGN